VLVKWNEDWAIYNGGLTIELKHNLHHLRSNWNIEVLCDDQPKAVLQAMFQLAADIKD
jgi:hypothetical protein